MTGLPLLRKCINRSRDFLQLGHAAAFQAAEVEVERADALVGLCRADRLDEVAQARFLRALAQRIGHGAFDGVAGELLDDGTLRRNDERRLVRDERDRPREQRADQPEQQQEQQEMQDLAQPVEAVPDPPQ